MELTTEKEGRDPEKEGSCSISTSQKSSEKSRRFGKREKTGRRKKRIIFS